LLPYLFLRHGCQLRRRFGRALRLQARLALGPQLLHRLGDLLQQATLTAG
jgi:hypothetical protein